MNRFTQRNGTLRERNIAHFATALWLWGKVVLFEATYFSSSRILHLGRMHGIFCRKIARSVRKENGHFFQERCMLKRVLRFWHCQNMVTYFTFWKEHCFSDTNSCLLHIFQRQNFSLGGFGKKSALLQNIFVFLNRSSFFQGRMHLGKAWCESARKLIFGTVLFGKVRQARYCSKECYTALLRLRNDLLLEEGIALQKQINIF